eukprot:4186273-Prymnesium_polylepis.1
MEVGTCGSCEQEDGIDDDSYSARLDESMLRTHDHYDQFKSQVDVQLESVNGRGSQLQWAELQEAFGNLACSAPDRSFSHRVFCVGRSNQSLCGSCARPMRPCAKCM